MIRAALTAFLILVFGSPELPHAAADIVWSGAGESGADPFGTPWLFQNSDTAFQDVASFGLPGRAMGTTSYFGPETVSAIMLEFFDLPAGVALSNFLPVNTPAMNVDPFSGDDLWDYSLLSTSAILFTPPTSDRTLDTQDRFFLWATFDGDIDFSTIDFRATYIISVPEPGSFATLFVIVPVCLAIRRRRLRHAGAA
jgi:hypothetical protein